MSSLGAYLPPPPDDDMEGGAPEPVADLGTAEPDPDHDVAQAKRKRRKKAEADGRVQPFEIAPDAMGRLSFEESEHLDRWGFFERNNRTYFMEKGAEGERVPVAKANFTMRILYRMDSDEFPRRVLELVNDQQRRVVVEMPVKSMQTPDGINEIAMAKGKYLWMTNKPQLQKVLMKLMDEERACIPIDTLGWQTEHGFWAWGNGIYNGEFQVPDSMGVITHKARHFYIPSSSPANRNNPAYQDERRFVFKHGAKVTFEQWGKLFAEVYKEQGNGIVGMCFWMAALYRDFIFSRTKFFPILFHFGMPMSGKSTLAKSIMELFGEAQEAIALSGNSTTKGFMRKFGQFHNGIVWLDEFKNASDPRLFESLKNLWDGIGYTTAQKSMDNKTKHQPIYAAAIVSGQDMPTAEAALFTRVILRRFERRDDRNPRTEAELAAFKQLREWEAAGLSHLTCEVLTHRKLIEAEWEEQYRATAKQLQAQMAAASVTFDDRLITNAAVLLATSRVLRPKLKLPFTDKEAMDALLNGMVSQSTVMAGTNDLAQFWDAVEELAMDRTIKFGEDYSYKDGLLYLSLSRTAGKYLELLAKQRRPGGLQKATLDSYLRHSPAWKEFKKSYRIGDYANTSCHVFYLDKLSVNLQQHVTEPEKPQQASLNDMLAHQQDGR